MHRSPRSMLWFLLLTLLAPATALAFAGNGKLQIHHIDVGQGDGALLISPNGQTVLFDDGNYLNCTNIKNYLQSLGITTVDYHFLSHYHSDHLGCIDDLAAIGITVGTKGYDRGYSYSSGTYTSYVNTLGAKRATIAKNQVITLDQGYANPVTIKCIDLNGAGVYSPSGGDENAKSVDLLVTYGAFREEIGGDLTGDPPSGNDVETTVGPEVGNVDVYKAHHHGSQYSNNDNWLNDVTAEVCVISCGDGNSYGHPTTAALTRMHNHGIHTYWTETGNGATPNPTWDKVAHGTIVIQAQPGAGAAYTVTGPGINDTYYNGGSAPPINTTQYPTALTMLKGSLATGDVTRLQVSDDSRIGVSAGVSSGQYWTDWYASVFLAHPPLDLTVTCETSFTISRTQTLYVYNWSTAAWDQVNSATVGTTDVTKTWSTSSPGDDVGPSREVRFRVAGSTNTGTYTSRGDFMSFNYDYASGTAPQRVTADAAREPIVALPAVAPGELSAAIPVAVDPLLGAPGSAAHLDPEAMTEAHPQSVLERLVASPAAGGAQLIWAVNKGDHVDGFNVYRQAADGSMVFAGNDADLSIEGEDAVFRFTDPSGDPTGVYWLGARACSGPEGMIGPIRIDAGAAGASGSALALAVGPNPTAGLTSFSFALDRPATATLSIFDLGGRRVATPLAGRCAAGAVRATWNLKNAAGRTVDPGVYFARLETLGRTLYTRVTVVKR